MSVEKEIWKVIPSFPTHEISNRGRVRRLFRSRNWPAGRCLSPHLDDDGYLRVKLGGSPRYIHVLMCEAFNGPCPEGQICRHLNDVKSDLRPDNLAWGTHSQNLEDAYRNGTARRQKRRFDRDEAKRLYGLGLSQEEIGFFLGVSGRAIGKGLKIAGIDCRRGPQLAPGIGPIQLDLW